jgi:hypothetical protein
MRQYLCTFKVPTVSEHVNVRVMASNPQSARGAAIDMMLKYDQIRTSAEAECLRVEEDQR